MNGPVPTETLPTALAGFDFSEQALTDPKVTTGRAPFSGPILRTL
jgi:hypothetical protein